MPNFDDELMRPLSEDELVQLYRARGRSERVTTTPPTEPVSPSIEARVTTLESQVASAMRSIGELMEMYRGLGSSRAREQQMNASITELGREVQRLRALVEPSVSVGVVPAADTPSLDDLVGRRIRFTPPHVGVGASMSEAWENLRETYVTLRHARFHDDPPPAGYTPLAGCDCDWCVYMRPHQSVTE